MNEANIIAIILTAIIATLALIIGNSTIRAAIDNRAPYEEKQARYHDKQANQLLDKIPNATNDQQHLLAELAHLHERKAHQWRTNPTNGQHEQAQKSAANTSNTAKKPTHHAGYAANPSTTTPQTSTPTHSKPITTTHDQHTPN